MKKLALLLLALPLAGCLHQGQAEYSPLPDTGPLTLTRLEIARAGCQLHQSDKVDASFNAGSFPDVNRLVEDAKLCFLTQGIRLDGWRQPNGTLTSTPWR